MRNRLLVFVSALVVAWPAASYAQMTLPVPTEPRDMVSAGFEGRAFGNIDFGGRFSSIGGDQARYERYRDLRDGPFAGGLSLHRRSADWTLSATARNVGDRDQRYFAEYRRVGNLRVSFLWDQVPLFISGDTRTLYSEVQPGVLRLDDVIQTNNQAGITTIRSYTDQAARFETRTRRDNGVLNVVFTATPDIDVKFNVTSTTRTGAIPYGASFGFNNLVEVAAPIDQRTTDATTSLEWANQRGMVAVGWDGSWFDNAIETLIWDNPLKITDAPSYSSAYSDGRGPSQGRMAMWPSNSQQYVHATGSFVTAGRGRATAYVAFGEARQNADLLPHTISTMINVIPLDRATAEAEVRNTIVHLQYTARPVRPFGVVARYRYADVDNRTPHFQMFGRVRLDGAEVLSGVHDPEPLSIKRKTFDVDGTLHALPFTSVKLGYTNDVYDRTHRVFEETEEDIVRVSLDAIGNQYVTVRALIEGATRRGSQFDEHLLEQFGEQPGMRHYDVANRDRRRATLIATTNPTAVLGLNFSAGVGRDEYPGTEFGLQAYDSNQYSVGFDLIPNDRVGLNLVYAWEDYASLTQSRTANPGPQFDDPRRNWMMDYDGTVKNVDATFEVAELVPRADVRLNLNLSDAADDYRYVLTADTVLPAPSQLDPVVNQLLRGELDVIYRLTNQVRLAATYWYEDFKTDDFALGPLTLSDIALPALRPEFPVSPTNSLLLGYLYRPYTAHTGMVRLIYLW